MVHTTRKKEAQPAPIVGNKTPPAEEHPAEGAGKIDTPDAAAKLDAILAALTKLDTKVDTMASDLNLLRADQRKVTESEEGRDGGGGSISSN